MRKSSLIVALVLSVAVTLLNFLENSFVYGSIMSIISILILLELAKQFKNSHR